MLISLATIVVYSDIVAACRDPKDDHVLACAIAGKADFIVTGDKDLLSMHTYGEIQILTVRQFVDAPILHRNRYHKI